MSTKSKNIKPRYFYNDGSTDGVPMLYAAYPDTSFFAVQNEWRESSNDLAWWQKHSDYAPCSLTDVRAHFNNISAHKRISTSTSAGTNPA